MNHTAALLISGSLAISTIALLAEPPPGLVQWVRQADVRNVAGAYTPVVLMGGSRIQIYVNWSGAARDPGGSWYRREGTWSTVGSPRLALLPGQVWDQTGSSPFVRTTAVQRGQTTGRYYALLHVGDGYPSATGFRPAWATSPDGETWTYRGQFTIDGEFSPYVFSSSAALIVQEDRPDSLDVLNPMDNRFLVWEDAYCFQGDCPGLALLYSADGLNWRFYRGPDKHIVDVWPYPNQRPVFPSVVKGTKGAFHLIAGDKWPVSVLRHVYSCDGLRWRILDEASPVRNPSTEKGTNLAYDAATGTVHALSSGHHWSFVDQGFPCASAVMEEKGGTPLASEGVARGEFRQVPRTLRVN